jgi:hypothetical protein
MKRICAAVVVVTLGCQGRRDRVETTPVHNATPSAPTPYQPTAEEIAEGEATALAMMQAEAAKDGSIVVRGLPMIPPQSRWMERIRAGGNPIIVAMAGRVTVSPFFQPEPGVWEYVVLEDGVFSLPIIGDTLPTASESETNLPGGRKVTTASVHITQKSTGEIADVGVIPWALPEPGHTIDADLDIYMAGEIALTGLTLDKAIHGPVGGAPGLLATAKGKVAGIDYQAMLWKIYLPESKRVLSYSVYSATPSDLRVTGEMMLKWFTVGNPP